MKTIYSKIDNQNFASNSRLENEAYKHMPSLNNEEVGQNLITHSGGATLADFVVALAQDMVYPFAHAPKNQAQGRRLQLVKI